MLGIKCRWDGRDKRNKKVIDLLSKEALIPICPEELGGLSTPREPAHREGKKVLTRSGKNVTENFVKGAGMVLAIAQNLNIKEAILKQKSPSCGCGKIYHGRKVIKGDGTTTELLKKYKIKVITEEDL